MYQNFIAVWTGEPLRRVREVFPRRLGRCRYDLGVRLGRLRSGIGFLRDDVRYGFEALLGPSGLGLETPLPGPQGLGIRTPLPRPLRRAGRLTRCTHGNAAPGAKFIVGAYTVSARATSPNPRTACCPLCGRLVVWSWHDTDIAALFINSSKNVARPIAAFQIRLESVALGVRRRLSPQGVTACRKAAAGGPPHTNHPMRGPDVRAAAMHGRRRCGR